MPDGGGVGGPPAPASTHGLAPPPGREWLARLRLGLRHLHYGHRPRDIAFQAALLCLDLASISYFLATTFVQGAPWVGQVDMALGVLLIADFASRALSYRRPVRYLESFTALTDILVIVSLFTSFLVENLVFLRTLRLLRAYHTLRQLGRLVPAVRRNQEVIAASLNVAVFVIMVSSVVYITQKPINPKIANFVDALYFTVTTLTTTGYGDIALEGVWGRLIAVGIMISGISLFLGLVQAVFRPHKIRFSCPDCGLGRHDADAVHCKACGRLLNIPDEGG
jgi:voltage-gated potassium channel